MLGFTRSREWIYSESVRGKYQSIRRVTFVGLHLIMFLVPWMTWAGHPLFRVDVPTRRTYLVGQIFTASDTLILVLVLLFGAFALFFFTSLFGRLWCGYACPQTVFLESWIRPIELWVEGGRGKRRWRDRKGLTFDLAWRKALKWTLFLAVAFLLAMATMSVFGGARELWTGQGGKVEYALVGVITVVWFWDFTWFREQFCNYLCPYARFQSALTDDETVQIQYDVPRGEPRGGGRDAARDGRCIECKKCVVVCPQGIDIRDGFQLECIGCAKCIDACANVMSELGHETLIDYSSLAGSQGKQPRRLRPRTVIYGGMLTGIAAAFVVLVSGRIPFEASVNRSPGTLYTLDADGFVRNTYLLNITNNYPGDTTVSYSVSVEGLEGAQVHLPVIQMAPEETRTLPLVVRILATDQLERTIPVQVRIATRVSERLLGTTFKTGAHVGSTP